MEDENVKVPPPIREQFERRTDFVRAYDRWRDKHDPKRKARKRPEGYQAEQYAKHREARRAAKKELYANKRDMLLERQAAWRDANRDKLQVRDQRRYKENPALIYAQSLLRKKRRTQAAPPWLTKEQWKEMAEMYEVARDLTVKTGVPHEVDHIHPLAGKTACGLHVPWNLQILTATENRKKRNGESPYG